MMNIREYFNRYYELNGMNKGMELEEKVWNWYNNNEERFEQWVEENKIDLYEVEEMMDGSEEYSLTLWCWDMED